jgi:hypothetical protein
MALYFMSGINGKKKKAKSGSGSGSGKPKKRKVAKVGLAPARASFLLVVNLNLLGLAKKLALAYRKDPTRVKNFWAKFGGQWSALASAISRGSKQKISGIGIAPAVALATATPIIVVVIPLIKDLLKGTPEGNTKDLEEGAQAGKDLLANDPNTPKSDASLPEGEDAGKVETEGSTGLIASGLIFQMLPLYLAIPIAFLFVHKYFSSYAPVKIKNTYNTKFARLCEFISSKFTSKKTITI